MSKSLDMIVKAYKAVKLNVAPYVLAPVLAVLPMACGNGGNGSNGPLEKPSKEYVQPADGSVVKGAELPAGILEVGVKTPGANPDYSGTPADNVYVVIEVRGNGWVKTVVDSTATLDSFVSGDLDTNTANNGEPIDDGEQLDFHAEFTPQGSDDTMPEELDWSVEYEGFDPNKPRVTGCYVVGSNVGVRLSINCVGEAPGGPSTLRGNWTVDTALEDVLMSDSGEIWTLRGMDAADVQLYTYTVTASDGTYTSDPFVFTVPVDEHESRIFLQCSDGTDHNLLLQESSIDAVSEACWAGYNSGLKPSTSADQDYIGDVDPNCAKTALEGRPEAEKEAHSNYNMSDLTPLEVFDNCTVTDAQVRYHHD